MNDNQPIRRRPRTRLVFDWPFLYSGVPGSAEIVTNVPRPAAETPASPRKITATDWPFPAAHPELTQRRPAKRVKLSPGAISPDDIYPPAPF